MKFAATVRARLLMLALSAASTVGAQGLLLPLDLSAQGPSVALHAIDEQGGVIHATLRAGERARDVARAYGIDPAFLGIDADARQPAGAVVRLPVEPGRLEPRLPPGVETRLVRPGDTLASIARSAGLTTLELLSANLDRQSLDRLVPGERLLVPTLSRGLVVRLKKGHDVVSLARLYDVDVALVARANALTSPTDVRVGDYVLLPGRLATSHMRELLARRERALEAERLRRVIDQYQRYLAYKREVERRRLQAKYERQKRFEQWQAYLRSPERRALEARYAAQARYEAWLAERARARLARDAEERRARAIRAEQPRVATRKVSAVAARATTKSGVVRRARFQGSTIVWPMRTYRITSRFAERDIAFHRAHFHGGIDLAAPYGTPIYAATSGVVQQAGFGDFGLNVWVQSGNATLIYGHMSRTAVRPGDTVDAGELLGFVGCTGVCTGPHLHFETRIDGDPVDPLALLP